VVNLDVWHLVAILVIVVIVSAFWPTGLSPRTREPLRGEYVRPDLIMPGVGWHLLTTGWNWLSTLIRRRGDRQ
jgi:hypothetical protein